MIQGVKDKQQLIFETAQKIFLEKSYVTISMDLIADLSGVARRALYNHFTSKEELFQAVVKQIWSELHDIKREEIDKKHLSVEEGLVHVGMLVARFWTSPKATDFLRLVIRESALFPELATMLYDFGKKPVLESLEQYFIDLEARNILQIEDMEIAVRQFVGLINEPLQGLRFIRANYPITEERVLYVVESAVSTFLSRYKIRDFQIHSK